MTSKSTFRKGGDKLLHNFSKSCFGSTFSKGGKGGKK